MQLTTVCSSMAGFRSKFRRRLFAIVKRRIERFISGIAVSLPLAFHNHLSRFCSGTPALIRGRQCSVSNASLLSGSVDTTTVGRGGKLRMLLAPTVSGQNSLQFIALDQGQQCNYA